MSIAKLYAWTDTNATPNTYYTDNTTIAVDMPLYNNQGVDTGAKINYIESTTKFNIDFTLTVNTTPTDATVTFNTGTVSGKTCSAPNGTSITYTIAKTGYVSKSYTIALTKTQTINAPALELDQLNVQYPDNTRLMITGLTEQFIPDSNLCKVQLTRVTNSNGHGAMVSYTEDSKFVSISSNPGTFWVEKNSNITVRAYYVTKSGILKTSVYHYADKEFNITGDTDIALTSSDYHT